MPELGPEGAALTHSQAQIWVGQKLNPTSPLYNMAFAFSFAKELEVELFLEAWRRIADTSDALRTRIVEQADGGVGRVVETRSCAVEVLDFASLREPDAEFRKWCQVRVGSY